MQQNLATMLYRRAAELGDTTCLRHKEEDGSHRDMNWPEFTRLIRETAAGLIHSGLERGSCAAIIAHTSHWWVISDFAIISTGAVTVPIYPTSSQLDLEYILKNSQASVVFVQDATVLGRVLSIRKSLPALRKIVLLPSLKRHAVPPALTVENDLVIELDKLRDAGRELMQKNPNLIEESISAIKPEDLATVVYTSGTTGLPKGVMLTHSNIAAVLNDLPESVPMYSDDVSLSYLPLSHVFERVCCEFYFFLHAGIVSYAGGIEHLAKDMSEVEPTMILAVPRVLDKIFAKVQSRIEHAPPVRRRLARWALKVAVEVVRVRAERKQPGVWLFLKHQLARLLVLRTLKNRIGRRLRIVITGGAPANRDVIEFFNAVGITTVEGYGLTETAAPAAVNRGDWIRPGTVGQPLAAAQFKVAPDGELLIKGPAVFKGYFRDDEATAAVFDQEGWFHTGDIGTIDGDGFVTIVDRKKDLIVNAAGENIAPQKIENVIRSVPLISHAVVAGEGERHPVALLFLDEVATVELAGAMGWNFDTFQHLITLPELQRYVGEQIKAKSVALAHHERIRTFAILDSNLSIDAGEVTPTLKIKRNIVCEKYKKVIGSLYNDEREMTNA